MKNLKSLKEKLLKQERLTRDLRQEVEDLENKKALPELRNKYEGKYFKYKNSYGGGETWWYYSFCKKVVKRNKFIVDSFQIVPDGKCECSINKDDYDTLFMIEITQREYKDALFKFIKKVNSLKDIS